MGAEIGIVPEQMGEMEYAITASKDSSPLINGLLSGRTFGVAACILSYVKFTGGVNGLGNVLLEV